MEKLAIHIIEDEAVIAMDLEDIIVELGHHVTGISASYKEVMRLLPADQSDIFLVYIHDHYTHIVARQRTHTLLRNLKKVHLELLNNSFFRRVHKSYLVNTRQIRQTEAANLVMADGSSVPLSRSYKKDAFQS